MVCALEEKERTAAVRKQQLLIVERTKLWTAVDRKENEGDICHFSRMVLLCAIRSLPTTKEISSSR